MAGVLLYQGYGLTIQSGLTPLKYFSLSLFFSFAFQPLYELLDGPANHIPSILERQLRICCQAVNFLQGEFVNGYRNSLHIRKICIRCQLISITLRMIITDGVIHSTSMKS